MLVDVLGLPIDLRLILAVAGFLLAAAVPDRGSLFKVQGIVGIAVGIALIVAGLMPGDIADNIMLYGAPTVIGFVIGSQGVTLSHVLGDSWPDRILRSAAFLVVSLTLVHLLFPQAL